MAGSTPSARAARGAARSADHLPLTAEVLRAAYDFLAATLPFNRWNLPDGEDVVFRVARTTDPMAWCTKLGKGRYLIAISQKKTAHTVTLMEHMAHEMIHVYQMESGMHSSCSQHNAAYGKLAAQVCRVHGFDLKLFY